MHYVHIAGDIVMPQAYMKYIWVGMSKQNRRELRNGMSHAFNYKI